MTIINKIETQDQKFKFDIGTDFNHVYYSENNDFSLMDFFNHMRSFLESDMFSIYSSFEPTQNNIKTWYDTEEKPVPIR